MSDEPDRDLLAAEYVLGCLEGEATAEARRLLADDADFARSVGAWRQRLAPLAAYAAPAEPPAELWGRIEAAVGAGSESVVPLRLRRRVRFWQAGTGVALAIAASLAAFIVLHRPEAPRVAVLAPMTGGVPVLLATAQPNGSLLISPNGTIAVPSDKDLELWALAKGDTRPRSLGVLPAGGRQLVASLAPGTQLLVSLEPKGGHRPGSRPGRYCTAGS